MHRESRRVSDDALVLLTDGTQDVGSAGDDGWWELPSALPSFMCPTPIGINVIDERIVLRRDPDDRRDGAPLANSSAEATVHCPDGDQAAFCQRICSGCIASRASASLAPRIINGVMGLDGERPHVVIIGGGFGGLYCARALARRAGAHHARRSAQPPPVSAAALPGGDRGAQPGRHRAADPRHRAQAAELRRAARRGRRRRRARQARHPRRRRRARPSTT